MRRKVANVLLTVSAFVGLIVGSGMASSAMWSSANAPPTAAKSDFRGTLVDASDNERRVVTPAIVIHINFDQAFSDATAVRSRDDIPPVREKLRDAGCRRIIGPRLPAAELAHSRPCARRTSHSAEMDLRL